MTFNISFGQKIIYGRISSIDGQPIRGVNVMTESRRIKTRTNKNGEYKITLTASEQKLIFKKRGFVTNEIELGTKTALDLTMIDAIEFQQEK